MRQEFLQLPETERKLYIDQAAIHRRVKDQAVRPGRLPQHFFTLAQQPSEKIERIEHADRFFNNTKAALTASLAANAGGMLRRWIP